MFVFTQAVAFQKINIAQKNPPHYCAKNTNYLVLQSCCLIFTQKLIFSSPVPAVCHISRTSRTQPAVAQSRLLKGQVWWHLSEVLLVTVGDSSPTRYGVHHILVSGTLPKCQIIAGRTAFLILKEQVFQKPFPNENCYILAIKKIKGGLVLVCSQHAPEFLRFHFNDTSFIMSSSASFTTWLKLQGLTAFTRPVIVWALIGVL